MMARERAAGTMRGVRLLPAMLAASMGMSLGVALPCAAQGSTPPQTSVVHRARLLGVFDEASGEPIEGVRVGDLLSGTYAATTKTGTVALSFLPAGGGMVRIQKLGYVMQTMFVAVTPADTAALTVILKRVTELPAVVTKADSSRHFLSPALRGFEERRHAGMGGYFISEAELRKAENSTLGNVVRRLPGVQIVEGSAAAWMLRSTRCIDGTTAGPPQVYLDGVPQPPPMRPDAVRMRGRGIDGIAYNLDDFQVSDLAGVEFYPDNATAPIDLPHLSTRCGILLLWTRER
jgi:hypothetical protein